MEIKILRAPTDGDWMLVKQCALVTAGKTPVTPPDTRWKEAILRARHSPIRELKYVFLLTGVPYYVSTHLARHHEGVQPYIRSQRNDRQSAYDRTKAPQDAPVDMILSVNAEGLINLANKRLCSRADPVTRRLVLGICEAAAGVTPEIGGELVPMCLRCGGVCHEMQTCGRAAWSD